MTSRRTLTDDNINSTLHGLLENDSDVSQASDSELEDHVSEDDVQSDFEDELIDNEAIVQSNDVTQENDPSEQVRLEPTENLERDLHDRRIIIPTRSVIRGRNRHCWSTSKGQRHGRTAAVNIIRTNRGPTRMCRNIFDPELCFGLFVTDEIVDEIVQWTNVEMSVKRRDNMNSATFRDTNSTELRAFIGILTLTAAMKDNHLTTDELFDSTFSGTRYVAVMSRDRFDFLIRCLRMDDKSLRPSIRQEDPFIPIRKVWELFITQCKLNYTPGEHVTIDEQLLGFRGRCPFRMYIPNKPNKYGIKIPMMCDNGTKYMLNAMPYIGRATNTNGLPQGAVMFQYYIKIVPTIYVKMDGSILFTNQFSVTRHHKSVSIVSAESGMPGAFFSYELSPLMVKYTEKERSLGHFATNICAIIGGVFTVAGIFDALLYHSLNAFQDKTLLGKSG